MEIQDFKSRWNGQPVELITAAEVDVLVNLDREREERIHYLAEKTAEIGWRVSQEISLPNDVYTRQRYVVVVGDNTTPATNEAAVARSFSEFRTDFEALIATLQRRVETSDYVMGAIRSLGFDVRPDTVVEKITAPEAETDVIAVFANTSAVVYISLQPGYREIRFVAVAGAGWYKVTFHGR